jgi:hypothetical protein
MRATTWNVSLLGTLVFGNNMEHELHLDCPETLTTGRRRNSSVQLVVMARLRPQVNANVL